MEVFEMPIWLWVAVVVGITSVKAYESGIYVDNVFTRRTEMVNKLHGASKRAIKQEVLSLLGLHNVPKHVSGGKHNSAPTYMLDLYRTLQNDVTNDVDIDEDVSWMYRIKQEILNKNLTLPGMEDKAEKADMIMSFVNSVNHGNRIRHHKNRVFYFDMSEVDPEEVLTGAELRLYKRSGDVTNTTLTLNIYLVKRGYQERDHVLELESNTTLLSWYEGWSDLNVTSAARRWSWYPNENLGLYMQLLDPKGNEISPKAAGFVTHGGPRDKQPFMVGFFTASQEVHIRRVRDVANQMEEARRQRNQGNDPDATNDAVEEVTNNDSDGPRENGVFFADEGYSRRDCQRRALYVSFKELGWQEWIIAPEGYPAFYCEGECSFPLNVHMNATNHAIVQTLVHLMNPFMVPKPDCAPTKLTAISVLYFDDNSNVILKKYRNMVVRACGCH